jgi:hypothetical protein
LEAICAQPASRAPGIPEAPLTAAFYDTSAAFNFGFSDGGGGGGGGDGGGGGGGGEVARPPSSAPPVGAAPLTPAAMAPMPAPVPAPTAPVTAPAAPADDFSFGDATSDTAFDFSAGAEDPFGFSNIALSGFNPVSPIKAKGLAPNASADPFAL